jgi:hypothetical protein
MNSIIESVIRLSEEINFNEILDRDEESEVEGKINNFMYNIFNKVSRSEFIAYFLLLHYSIDYYLDISTEKYGIPTVYIEYLFHGPFEDIINESGTLLQRIKKIIDFIENRTFKSIAKKIKTLANVKDIYNWQSLCRELGNNNLPQLKELAKLEKITIQNKNKRQLCMALAKKMEKKLKVSVSDCTNLNSILGDDVADILKPLLFKVKEGNTVYCFNILELENMEINPFTRKKLPVKQINKKLKKLRKTLLPERLELTNVIEEIKNNPIFNKTQVELQTIRNIFSKLNYTPDSTSFYNNLNSAQFRNELVTKLRELGVYVNPVQDRSSFILELARIVNYSSTHRAILDTVL